MPSRITHALSVRQPYASLIMAGVKRFEVRSWQTNTRGRIAIHASEAFAHDWREYEDHWYYTEVLRAARLPVVRELPRSAVLGTVELAAMWPPKTIPDNFTLEDALFAVDPVAESAFLFEMRRPKRLREPVPCHGKLNLWLLPPAVAARVNAK